MLFLQFNSFNGMNSANATGVPRVGHGGSFAQACKIRSARKFLPVQYGHSISTRRGASKTWPSFVCNDFIYLFSSLKCSIVTLLTNTNLNGCQQLID